MAIKQAVILAAGTGSRLGKNGEDRPKGFIEVNGEPIVQRSVRLLLSRGMEDVIIVTGHQRDYYQRLAERFSDVIRLIHNPYYASSGSLYSLYCALPLVESDILLLESDLVYESRALDIALDAAQPDVVLLCEQMKSGDQVYVETYTSNGEDCLANMSKDKSELGSDVPGELVGISRLSMEALHMMIADISDDDRMYDYEVDGLVGAAENRCIYCPTCNNLAWSEIDDMRQYNRVLEEIYPAIQRMESNSPIA